MKRAFFAICIVVASGFILAAQTTPTWDKTGSSLLNGTYNFRHVVYDTSVVRGQVAKGLLLYGTISFDGSGVYSISGTRVDTSVSNGAPTPATLAGTYTIAASGLGSLTDPLVPGDTIYGMVSNGIFIGGSSSTGIHDLFVAARVSPSASFKGGYYVTGMDAPTADPNDIRDFWLQLSPDGAGGLGNVVLSGYVASGNSFPVSQAIPSVRYSFINGVGNLMFPAATLTDSTFVRGPQTFYVSPDGNFIFGGSPTAFNMFVGVLATASNIDDSNVSGLYYQAGIDHDSSQITTGLTGLSNYYGSMVPANGLLTSHQRINALVYPSPTDYTFSDYYILHSDGTSTDSFQNYWLSTGGNIRVGVGLSPYLGINVALKAPKFSGTGVYINPTGVVNSASFAPFTTGVSPGEFVTLFGTNLAPSTMESTSVPVPTRLNGVQVLVNGVAAPVWYVSPTQISFLIPFATTSIASIQVNNNGTASNTVTSYIRSTTPGLFTIPSGGVSSAAATHLDGTLVSETNPAQVGETLQMYVAGLGTVNPSIEDGNVGPSETLSRTNDQITVHIDRQLAKMTYAGLAPNLIGSYQVNFEVPSGTHVGNVFVDIGTSEADSSQAYIFIAQGPNTLGLRKKTEQSQLKSRRNPPSRRLVAK